jgi:23S rRNA-intervening sequence protein
VKTDEKKENEKLNGRIGDTAKKAIRHFRDLDVYQNALETGLRIYELSKAFPESERYALTDQIRRSPRVPSVQTLRRPGANAATVRLSFPS